MLIIYTKHRTYIVGIVISVVLMVSQKNRGQISFYYSNLCSDFIPICYMYQCFGSAYSEIADPDPGYNMWANHMHSLQVKNFQFFLLFYSKKIYLADGPKNSC